MYFIGTEKSPSMIIKDFRNGKNAEKSGNFSTKVRKNIHFFVGTTIMSSDPMGTLTNKKKIQGAWKTVVPKVCKVFLKRVDLKFIS